MKLEFKLGVSTKHRAISIQFRHPTQQLVMPVETALELAKRLLMLTREIMGSDERKRVMENMIKEIQ